MNPTELAQSLLQWQGLKEQMDELEEAIKEAVLKLGKTQTVGDVRASYSKGRTTYDYETPASSFATDEQMEAFKKVSYDWRGMCEAYGFEPAVKSVSPPSVTVKLLS